MNGMIFWCGVVMCVVLGVGVQELSGVKKGV